MIEPPEGLAASFSRTSSTAALACFGMVGVLVDCNRWRIFWPNRQTHTADLKNAQTNLQWPKARLVVMLSDQILCGSVPLQTNVPEKLKGYGKNSKLFGEVEYLAKAREISNYGFYNLTIFPIFCILSCMLVFLDSPWILRRTK